MKICSIVGARPQFIKLQPFSEEIRKVAQEIIIHTGQHYDNNMSDTFFQELNIPQPDYNLDVRSPYQGAQTAKMLAGIEDLLIEHKPDAVIVFGDTNSTLAGALAAVKIHIPTIHIEAGLRSFNQLMPEEINRISTDHIASYLFAPTATAIANLKKEGLEDRSFLTGDIMVDSLKKGVEKAQKGAMIMDELNLKANQFYLLTLHRPSNVDDFNKLRLLLTKLNSLQYPVLFPIHPRTKKSIHNGLNEIDKLTNIIFIEPQSYLNFISLQMNSHKILTDSGGIQKEAYILRKPCLTIRDETEWVETVTEGWNVLCNPNEDDFLEKIVHHTPPPAYREIFGNNVAKTIAGLTMKLIGNSDDRKI